MGMIMFLLIFFIFVIFLGLVVKVFLVIWIYKDVE